MIGNTSLKSIVVIKGKLSERTATRQQLVRTLRYLAGIARAFAGENEISMCIDETTIGDEPTMWLCIFSTKRQLGAWLLPQALLDELQTG